jgi:peptidyl-tRNA hydrolase, PTH1 family
MNDRIAVVGLGNPGAPYYKTRHNIGFRVVDALAEELGASWQEHRNMLLAHALYDGNELLLIKPQTFMNASGLISPFLARKGILPDHVVVVHDDLELPFGKVTFKTGGSARGHNGLKSIIAAIGPSFHRVRCGIGRPPDRQDVPDYVLQPFSEGHEAVATLIQAAVGLLREKLSKGLKSLNALVPVALFLIPHLTVGL